MNARLVLDFEAVEGAVVRMLGLIERRGFQLRRLAMEEGEAGEARLTVEVEARDAHRSFDVLELQLRRLQEVRSVSCSTSVPS